MSPSKSKRKARIGTRPAYGLPVDRPGAVRRRVHVLAEDETVVEREDVDALPFAAARLRSPLTHGKVVAAVEAARREREVRVVAEDPSDVLAHGVRALRALVGGVVVEDDVGV